MVDSSEVDIPKFFESRAGQRYLAGCEAGAWRCVAMKTLICFWAAGFRTRRFSQHRLPIVIVSLRVSCVASSRRGLTSHCFGCSICANAMLCFKSFLVRSRPVNNSKTIFVFSYFSRTFPANLCVSKDLLSFHCFL